MPLLTLDNQTHPFSFEWNGVKSCEDFVAIEGATLGEAAHLSACKCVFHRMLRSEDASVSPSK